MQWSEVGFCGVENILCGCGHAHPKLVSGVSAHYRYAFDTKLIGHELFQEGVSVRSQHSLRRTLVMFPPFALLLSWGPKGRPTDNIWQQLGKGD